MAHTHNGNGNGRVAADDLASRVADAVRGIINPTEYMSLPGSIRGNYAVQTTALPKGYVAAYAELVFVTPAMARDILSKCFYERQRDLNLGHVDFIRRLCINGQFQQYTPIFIISAPGGDHVGDANHRLHAIASEPTEGEWFTIIRLEVVSDAMVGQIYSRLDGGRMRSRADAAKALNLPNLKGWRAAQVRFASTAISNLLANCENESSRSTGRHSNDAIIGAVNKCADRFAAYYNMLSSLTGDTKGLINAPAVTVGMFLAYDQPEKAREFYKGLMNPQSLCANDPRRDLADILARTTVQTVRVHNYIRALADAWNAWNAGLPFPYSYTEMLERALDKSTPRKNFALVGTELTNNMRKFDLNTGWFAD